MKRPHVCAVTLVTADGERLSVSPGDTVLLTTNLNVSEDQPPSRAAWVASDTRAGPHDPAVWANITVTGSTTHRMLVEEA